MMEAKKRRQWQDTDPPDEDIMDLTFYSADDLDTSTTTCTTNSTSDKSFVDYFNEFEETNDKSPNKPVHISPQKEIPTKNTTPANTTTSTTSTTTSSTTAKTKTKLKLHRTTKLPNVLPSDFHIDVPSFSGASDEPKANTRTSRIPSPPVFDEPAIITTSSTKPDYHASYSRPSTSTSTPVNTPPTTPKATPPLATSPKYSSPESDDLPPAQFYDSISPKKASVPLSNFKRLKKLSNDDTPNATNNFTSAAHSPPPTHKTKPDTKPFPPSSDTKPFPASSAKSKNADVELDDVSEVPMSECPICFKKVPTSFLETHAQQELDAQEAPRSPARNDKVKQRPPVRTFPSPPPSPPSRRSRSQRKKSPRAAKSKSRDRKQISTDSEGDELSESDVSDYSSDGGFVVHGSDEETELDAETEIDEDEEWQEGDEMGWEGKREERKRKVDKMENGDVVEILDSSDEEQKPMLKKGKYKQCPICDTPVPVAQFDAHFEAERAELEGFSLSQEETAQQQTRQPQQKSDPFTPRFASFLNNQPNHSNNASTAPNQDDDGVTLHFTPIRQLSDSSIDFQRQFSELTKASKGKASNSKSTNTNSRNNDNFNNNNNNYNNFNNNNYNNFTNNNNNTQKYRRGNYNKNRGGYNKYNNSRYKRSNWKKSKGSSTSSITTLKSSKAKTERKPKTEKKTTSRKPKSEKSVKTESKVKSESRKAKPDTGRQHLYAGDSFSFSRGGKSTYESSRGYSLGGDI